MSDARWGDPREYCERERDGERPRVYDDRDRDDCDPRDGLMNDLDLPRGEGRELVVHRDRAYEMDGEDSRTLAAVGAFRVVPEHDLDIDHNTLDHPGIRRTHSAARRGSLGPGVTRLPPAAAGTVLSGRDYVRRNSIQSNRRNRTAFQVLGTR